MRRRTHRNPESHRTRVRAARAGWRHRSHRRRRFSHNPFRVRGMMGNVMKGLKGGTGVVLGKAAVRALPTLVRLPTAGVLGAAVQGLTGVILAPVVQKFLGGEWGTAFLYGAFAAPIESLIVGMNIPLLAPALSAYPGAGLSAYPGGGPLGAIPTPHGIPTLAEVAPDDEEGFVQ